MTCSKPKHHINNLVVLYVQHKVMQARLGESHVPMWRL